MLKGRGVYCIEGRGVEVEWCVGTGRGVEGGGGEKGRGV